MITFRMQGVTLIELVIVVLIMSITVAVVVPNLSSTDPARLDLAVTRIAEAMRMARSESMRSGEIHGVTISQDTHSIEVKKYDITTAPVSTDFVLTHPLQKQIYSFNINTDSLTKGITISNTQDAFLYNDGNRRKSLLFDKTGAPIWFFGSTDAIFQLTNGIVQLSYGGQTREIHIAPLTGRVSQP